MKENAMCEEYGLASSETGQRTEADLLKRLQSSGEIL